MATETYFLDRSLSPPAWRSYTDGHIVLGSTPPPPRVFGDPGQGNLYLGQTNLDGSAPNSPAVLRETTYGHRVGVNRDYFDQESADASVDAIAADLAKGRVPWKSYKLTTQTWAQFGASPAPWFANMCADIDAIGRGPVMLTLHHESNPGGGTGMGAADHIAMYLAAKTITDAYPQILLTVCLLGGFDTVGRLGVKFSDWITADGCDIFGFDSYNHVSYNPANGKKNLTVQQMFGLQFAQFHAIDPVKPIAVGEWGVRTNPTVPGMAATFMQDAFDYARLNGCYALSWFDSGTNVGDKGSPWFLDDTTDGTDGTERLNKHKSLLTVNSHSVFIPPGGLVAP